MRLQRSWSLASPWFLALFLCGAPIALGATITVNTTADTHANDGQCTLGEAILAANTNTASGAAAGECAAGVSGLDTIQFNVSGAGCAGGVCTIAPSSVLPEITEPVILDATTQPGYAGSPLIRIDWTHPVGATGLRVTAGGSTVKGLSITHFSDAVQLTSGGNNTIRANWLGLDTTGALAGNDVGVHIDGSNNNTIGGTTAADRNVVAGAGSNQISVEGGSTGNLIQGNYLGTDPTGNVAPGGAVAGVVLAFASDNTIGGTAAGAGNLISGNTIGVVVAFEPGLPATGNLVAGNLIGTNAAGTAALPNTETGVLFASCPNTLGGTTASARNVISGNGGAGLQVSGSGCVVQGNFFGTDAAGSAPLGNGSDGIDVLGSNNVIGGTAAGAGNVVAFNGHAGIAVRAGTGHSIRGNAIFSNGTAVPGLGIDIAIDGVTPNDPGDADTGPNNKQNFPVLLSALSGGGSTTILGTLNSAASTNYQIDFYSSVSCDPSGYGEGQTYLGSKAVSTDGSGNASFNATFPVPVSPQSRLTATATDPNGNTSEFCSCLSLQAQYHTITPCRVADTRTTSPPALAAGANRSFTVGGQCGIPATAQAVAFNFTVTQPTTAGDLRIFTGGGALPLVSTMNYRAGQTRANNGTVPLGPSGDIVVHVDQASGTVHFVIDVNGYFQ